jgi:hypothetical protein
MVTALLVSDFLKPKNGRAANRQELLRKLLAFARIIDKSAPLPRDRKLAAWIRDYRQASVRQTTHPGQREIRQTRFIEIMKVI